MREKLLLDTIICGDSAEILPTLPDESVDLIATDPPYGISFMGRNWDRAVPSVQVWKECLRVLNAGAFAFVMSSPRLDCLGEMSRRLQEAGFNIGFTPIFHAYATGFPKAENITKAVEKKLGRERRINGKGQRQSSSGFGGDAYGDTSGFLPQAETASLEAKSLEGAYGGFQVKPAVELVLVSMKPLSEQTYVDQALRKRKGITWLHDCRIPVISERYEFKRRGFHERMKPDGPTRPYEGGWKAGTVKAAESKGRFPGNLLVSDNALDDGIIHDKGGSICNAPPRKNQVYGEDKRPRGDWVSYGDSGSFSRYFSLDKWWLERVKKLPTQVQKVFPFLLVSKPNKREKNAGLESEPVGQAVGGGGLTPIGHAYGSVKPKQPNWHPTVKPIKLMSYLITLGSRPGDVVLDPFAGTGTSCIASALLNRHYVGVEIDPQYCRIAEKRLAWFQVKRGLCNPMLPILAFHAVLQRLWNAVHPSSTHSLSRSSPPQRTWLQNDKVDKEVWK